MNLLDAMKVRHSVRTFTEQPIDETTAEALRKAIDKCSAESGLHIQLILNEPKAFDCMMARYGNFTNCRNYIALVGENDCDELCGYYGEQLVLMAQTLGLNSCWVALSYSRSRVPCDLRSNERIQAVIALGYGTTQGIPHKTKPLEALSCVEGGGERPEWFLAGVKAAQLAPTAMNQQKFLLTLSGKIVTIRALSGFYTEMDLGIVRYHFELGAGKNNFEWGY